MTLPTLSKQKSVRVQAIKNKLISSPPGICSERLRYYTRAYQMNRSQPPIISRALALRDYLENVTLYFDENLIIPGEVASHPRWAPVFPEYSWKWVYDELDQYEQRQFDRFTITTEVKKELADLLPWWEGRSVYERVLGRQPSEVLDASDIGVLSWTGQATSGEGHIVIDHSLALRLGFTKIREIASDYQQQLALYEPDSLGKRDFYESVEIVCDGILAYASRMEKFLVGYAEREGNLNRRQEIESIIEDLQTIPGESAKTFRQALITVWFSHMIQQIESNGHSTSLGRFDQYLYPYYSEDIEKGRLTEDEALELIEHFYLKLFSLTTSRRGIRCHSGRFELI